MRFKPSRPLSGVIIPPSEERTLKSPEKGLKRGFSLGVVPRLSKKVMRGV